MGRLNISGTMRDRKLKFYVHLDRAKYSFSGIKIFPLGASGGHSAHYCKFETPTYLGTY